MENGSAFPPTTYADWLQRHAVTRGNTVAVATPNGRLTYAGFYRGLHAVAYRLAESGIERGQVVGISVASQTLHCVLIAALNRMGCVPVSLTRPPNKDVPLVLPDRLTVDRVLVEQPFEGKAPPGSVSVHLDWLKTANEKPREWTASGLPDSHAPAQIFTSSGTTGTQKAVAYSTRKIEMRLLKRSIGALNMGLTGKTMCQFGLKSTGGFRLTFSTFWAGGTVFLGFPDDAVPRLIAENRIERVEGSPAQFQWMLKNGNPAQHDLSSLRLACVAGSAVPHALAAAIRSRLCRLLICHYGATELGAVAFGPLGVSYPPGYCGHLVPWIQAQVVDPDDNPLPAGKEGNLRFRCEEMATGYLNDPDATARFFREGWFYTGDMGSISEERALAVAGRSSERINAGGVKVAPEIIESAVQSCRGVQDCAAFGMPDALGVEKIWLAVVADADIEIAAIRKHCLAKLGQRAPQRIVRLDALPRNEMGKVLRGLLPGLASAALAVEQKTPA